jgi:bifunctional ADP-heptose synthase (sugar kinase/adenylyltransferase)
MRRSLVTWFDEDTPDRSASSKCQPDVLVKGGDWAGGAHRRGYTETLARGGTVHSIPFDPPALDDGSLLDKIRRL